MSLYIVIDNNQETIHLPVPLGTPVFINNYNQHDGYYTELVEYNLSYINRVVYLTRKEAEKDAKECK
jgi:hypothetical protein